MWKGLCFPWRQNFNLLSIFTSSKCYVRPLLPLLCLPVMPFPLPGQHQHFFQISASPPSWGTSWPPSSARWPWPSHFMPLLCSTHIFMTASMMLYFTWLCLHKVQDRCPANAYWMSSCVCAMEKALPWGLGGPGSGKCVNVAESLPSFWASMFSSLKCGSWNWWDLR